MEPKEQNKNFAYSILFIIAGVLVFLVGFLVGRIDIQNEPLGSRILSQNVFGSESLDADTLWEVIDNLEEHYIEKDLDSEKFSDGMIKGLVDSLDDPYTSYLTKEETGEYLEQNAGKFEGIGTTLRYTGEYTEIESPIDGYPAAAAGLRPGDVILEVDGQDVVGKRAHVVADLIKGEAGTDVTLKLLRKEEVKPIEVTIIRTKVDLDSITFKELEDGIILIKINQFTEDDLTTFRRQWDETVKEVRDKNPEKIVLDLRNNPGGFVDGVIYVATEFFPKDTLIMAEEDRDDKRTEKRTTRDGRFEDVELVVIVNEGSASAAEIMAGAIQDHKRAKIIGMPTTGKGVEQRILPLRNGGSLHVVFQLWLLPSGRNISKESPIEPDIKVELTTEDFKDKKDPQLDRAMEELR